MQLTIIDAETNSFSASKGINLRWEQRRICFFYGFLVALDQSETYQYAGTVVNRSTGKSYCAMTFSSFSSQRVELELALTMEKAAQR